MAKQDDGGRLQPIKNEHEVVADLANICRAMAVLRPAPADPRPLYPKLEAVPDCLDFTCEECGAQIGEECRTSGPKHRTRRPHITRASRKYAPLAKNRLALHEYARQVDEWERRHRPLADIVEQQTREIVNVVRTQTKSLMIAMLAVNNWPSRDEFRRRLAENMAPSWVDEICILAEKRRKENHD